MLCESMDGDNMVEVLCEKCGINIDEGEVEVIDIEEDVYGRDILTFVCLYCKTKQKSTRRG